ncbi:MAG: YcxB family protein [Clostridia bacterium]|nr:YcxB family protein [Clostridia bacterium]
MEIKNTTLVDEKMFVKLQHFGLRIFKKHNFLNYLFWSIIAFFAFLYSAVSIVLFYVSDKDVGFPYYGLLVCVLLTGIHFICYFVLPTQMYKASPLHGGKEKYVFREDVIFCETSNPKCSTSAEYGYGSITKVYEKTGVFYVYVSKHNVLLVSKCGFENEAELETVREKLKASVPAGKYKIIK